MIADTRTLPQPTVQTTGDDISHEACCLDEEATCNRIAMCGEPIPDGELLGSDEPTCVVCLDLIDQWAENADRYGDDPTRPDDPPCRCCPRAFMDTR